MNKQDHLILGTAGHIDHGKSSLIRALTGVDPDRLKEEKARGITIELGFAQLELPDGTTMGVIDVPGHERFVRQMISGSTGVDVALLCIAADDGIMPQTIEHLAVLQLLNIPSCVVALTKADMVDDDWIELVEGEITAYLAATPYADAQIVPVSSKTEAGLENLKLAILDVTRQHRTRPRGSLTRLPIDRVFTIKGSGTVVTGTLWGGAISPDDEIEVLPAKKRARVRSVQVHGQNVQNAEPGNRVAVNLSGLTTREVRPGDFLVEVDALKTTDHFDAHFTYIDTAKTGKPLKSGTRVRVAHGTKEVLGRFLLISETGRDTADAAEKSANDVDTLTPGSSGFVQIRLEEPLPLMRNDHFILRSYSPISVIGGGRVLRASPRRSSNLSQAEYSFLEALEQDDSTEIINQAIRFETFPFTVDALAKRSETDRITVGRQIDCLLKSGALLGLATVSGVAYYATAAVLSSNLAKIENLLLAFHTENPDQPGIKKAALIQRFGKYVDQGAFDALVREAEKAGLLQIEDGVISHPKAGAGLRKADEKAASVILGMLKDGSATPPLLPDLLRQSRLDSGVALRALSLLEKQGLIYRINKELYYEKSAFEQLKSKARAYFQENARAQASELKEALGLSRKFAIPLFEHWDSNGFTKRDGDFRVIGSRD